MGGLRLPRSDYTSSHVIANPNAYKAQYLFARETYGDHIINNHINSLSRTLTAGAAVGQSGVVRAHANVAGLRTATLPNCIVLGDSDGTLTVRTAAASLSERAFTYLEH